MLMSEIIAVTGEENMTSPPDDREPAPVATFTPAE
jgi:hypothetical protein